MVFYKEDEIRKSKIILTLLRAVMSGIAILALIACALCCAFTTTATDQRMFFTAAVVSILAGWVIILLEALAERPRKAEYQHMRSILSDDDPVISVYGTISRTGETVHIPGSIDVDKVSIVDENGEGIKANVMARKAKCLSVDQKPRTIRMIRSFIVEVEDE